jgi:hypothetical protein
MGRANDTRALGAAQTLHTCARASSVLVVDGPWGCDVGWDETRGRMRATLCHSSPSKNYTTSGNVRSAHQVTY